MVEVTCRCAAIIFSHHNLPVNSIAIKGLQETTFFNQKHLKDTLHCNSILGIFVMYKQINGKSESEMCLVYKEFCLFYYLYIIQTGFRLHTPQCRRSFSELTEHLAQWEPALHLGILDATTVQIHNGTTKWTRFLLPSLSHQDASIGLPNEQPRFKFSQVWRSGRFCGSSCS